MGKATYKGIIKSTEMVSTSEDPGKHVPNSIDARAGWHGMALDRAENNSRRSVAHSCIVNEKWFSYFDTVLVMTF